MHRVGKTSEALLRTSARIVSLKRPWLALVTRSGLRADILAGLPNAAIVLPQGGAFAIIAGLPREFGLYTAMLLVLSPLVVHIPVPAVAGIILFVAWRLIDVAEILHRPAETVILALTFLCGVLIELEFSIIVGVLRPWQCSSIEADVPPAGPSFMTRICGSWRAFNQGSQCQAAAHAVGPRIFRCRPRPRRQSAAASSP